MELNALSESLDGAMVEALGDIAADITEAACADAYRAVGRADDRRRRKRAQAAVYAARARHSANAAERLSL